MFQATTYSRLLALALPEETGARSNASIILALALITVLILQILSRPESSVQNQQQSDKQ